jgi:Mor family transcriptional regulator
LIKRVKDMNRIEKLTASNDLTELLCNLEKISADPEAAADLLPEFCDYKDEGCELAPACLECPFPQCAYDRPSGQVKIDTSLRDQYIRRLFYQENLSFEALAKQFSLNERTVRRAIARGETATDVARRDQAIRDQFGQSGQSAAVLAKRFGVSKTTVLRALKTGVQNSRRRLAPPSIICLVLNAI